jgi:hypothetical protein
MKAITAKALILKRFLAFALVLAMVSVASGYAQDKDEATSSPDGNPPLADYLPFSPGEELTYELLWWGVPAGRAVMRIDESTEHDGHLVWQITSTANSSQFVDVFYKVRDRVISMFDPALRAPRYYKIEQRRKGHLY